MRPAVRFLAALWATALFSRLAWAQGDAGDPPPAYETVVVAPAPRDGPMDDSPGLGLEIEARDAIGQMTTVGELLEQSVGVSVRQLGGLGSYTTLSIRGASARQVLVLLDGVPLTTAADSAVDLSLVPADLLESIAVYRSGAPLWLGSAPMGSVVDLRTRSEGARQLALSASAGSFSTWKASAVVSTPVLEHPDWDMLLALTYLGSEGDFPFHDDRGTPLNSEDDREAIRQNSDFESGHFLARTTVEPNPAVRIGVQQIARVDRRGVPGIAQFQSERAVLEQLRWLSLLRVSSWGFPSSDADLEAHVALDRTSDRFSDRLGETGLGRRDVETSGWGVDGRVHTTHYVTQELTLDAALEVRWEQLRALDLLQDAPATGATRTGLSPTAQLTAQLFDRRLTLSGGLRLDFVGSAFTEAIPFADSPLAPEAERTDVIWQSQGGARWEVLRSPLSVELRGTVGRFARLPVLSEMFGDHGAVVGNQLLLPEAAWGGDLGLAPEWTRGRWTLGGVVAVFRYQYEDLIQLIQNSQYVARPENVASARVQGLEASLEVRLSGSSSADPRRGLWWAAGYTLTDAIDTSDVAGQRGNALPGRARHLFSTRLGGHWRGLEAAYWIDVESGNVLDRAGFRVVPDRQLHGARLSYNPAWAPQWTLAVESRNLLDHRVEEVPVLPQPPGVEVTSPQAVADYLGYPLPGRTLYVTLKWELL